MSETERETVRKLLLKLPSTAKRWQEAAKMGLTSWFIATLLFIFAWDFIVWLINKTIHKKVSWIWVVVSVSLGLAIYFIIESIRWVKKWPDNRKEYQADIETGQVVEESYVFNAAKRFQEQEHGGLIYFLRTTDNKVFALFDHESQNLGVENKNPLNSKFQPTTELLIVRAPKSELVISRQFSGTPLDAGEINDLLVGPKSWPEDEEYCKIPWDELEMRLTKKSKKK